MGAHYGQIQGWRSDVPNMSWSWYNNDPNYKAHTSSQIASLMPIFVITNEEAELTKINEEIEDVPQGEQKLASELKEGEYVYYPARDGTQILCQVLYDEAYNEENKTNYGVQLMACEEVSKAEIKDMTTVANMINYLNTKVEELRNEEITDEGYTRHLGTNPLISSKTTGSDIDLNHLNELIKNKKIDGTKLADCWYAWGNVTQYIDGGVCSCGFDTGERNHSYYYNRLLLNRSRRFIL